jgi:hypothetical protein
MTAPHIPAHRVWLMVWLCCRYPEGRIHHEETILGEISEPLRVAIAKHRYEAMLAKLQAYMTEDGLEDAMIARLEHSIFVQDDVVIAQGQRNTIGMHRRLRQCTPSYTVCV